MNFACVKSQIENHQTLTYINAAAVDFFYPLGEGHCMVKFRSGAAIVIAEEAAAFKHALLAGGVE